MKYVKAGDPEAVPVSHTPPSEDDELATVFARALPETEPRVVPQFAERLVRFGFIKVRGQGLMDHDCYVAADQIASADEDQVRLTVSADELVVEQQRWI